MDFFFQTVKHLLRPKNLMVEIGIGLSIRNIYQRMENIWVSGFNGFQQITDDDVNLVSAYIKKKCEYEYKKSGKCTNCLMTWSKIICLNDDGGILWATHTESQKSKHHIKTVTNVGENVIYLCENKRIFIHKDGSDNWEPLCIMDKDSKGTDLDEIKCMCGTDTTLIIAYENGCCESLNFDGSRLSIPIHVESKVKVDNVCCGKEHTILLGRDGQIYTYGGGSRGQLGHDDMTRRESPCLVEALAGIKCTLIAAGGWHSLAVSEFNDVYVWGWNEIGQLGLPCKSLVGSHSSETQILKRIGVYHGHLLLDKEADDSVKQNVYSPCQDECDEASAHWTEIADNVCHEILTKSHIQADISSSLLVKKENVKENEQTYGASKLTTVEHQTQQVNASKILDCVSPTESKKTVGEVIDSMESHIFVQNVKAIQTQCIPLPLDLLDSVKVKKITCGTRHTAILTDNGVLLTCGWNGYGQLCHRDLHSRDYLQTVDTFIKLGLKVKDVFCDCWNTVVITN